MSGLPDWPLFGLADDVRPALARARASGRPMALATITGVVGGSPRPVGSQMLVVDGEPHGFLSGGCIEADICLHAADVLERGRPIRLVYGEGSPFPDIRLVCGGRVDILLEPLGPEDEAAGRLLRLAGERREAVWVSDGERRGCFAADDPAPSFAGPRPLLAAMADPAVVGATLADGAATAGVALARRVLPPRRLIVIGSDPTALAISGLAAQSEFETWLVRPKGPEAPPPVPGVRYDRRGVETALPAIGLDRWTYVAAATHDLSSDEAALALALASPAAYVGALGARRRLPERLARLRARGLAEDQLARLSAPIGLDLGGKAPYEIAVAVMAEVIQRRTAVDPARWLQLHQEPVGAD